MNEINEMKTERLLCAELSQIQCSCESTLVIFIPDDLIRFLFVGSLDP